MSNYDGFLASFKCEHKVFHDQADCSDCYSEQSGEELWCSQCKLKAELQRILAKYDRLKHNVLDYLAYQLKIKQAMEDVNTKFSLINDMHTELEYRAKDENETT